MVKPHMKGGLTAVGYAPFQIDQSTPEGAPLNRHGRRKAASKRRWPKGAKVHPQRASAEQVKIIQRAKTLDKVE